MLKFREKIKKEREWEEKNKNKAISVALLYHLFKIMTHLRFVCAIKENQYFPVLK